MLTLWILETSRSQTTFATLMLLACAVYVIRRDFWWFADEVWDDGEALRILCNGREAFAPFSVVDKVTIIPQYSRSMIAIDFTVPVPSIGDGVAFYPVRGSSSDSTSAEVIVQALRAKAGHG